jgi:hypothetical protein
MGLVSSVRRRDSFLLGYDDATAALADNLYLLLNRDKIGKLVKFETVGLSSDAETRARSGPQLASHERWEPYAKRGDTLSKDRAARSR